MSSYQEHVQPGRNVAAPRTVNVLPSHVARRLTRRDGLLPLVLAAELVAGIAFGLASHAADRATSVPARLTLGNAVTAMPRTDLAASVQAGAPSAVLPVQGPVAPRPMGPPVGPVVPGTRRAPMPADTTPVAAAVAPVAAVADPVTVPSPYPTHAPRDPFAALVTAPRA